MAVDAWPPVSGFLACPISHPGHDGQNQHHRRHGPFLKKLHKRMSSPSLSPASGKGG